jgi:hypothetical protein
MFRWLVCFGMRGIAAVSQLFSSLLVRLCRFVVVVVVVIDFVISPKRLVGVNKLFGLFALHTRTLLPKVFDFFRHVPLLPLSRTVIRFGLLSRVMSRTRTGKRKKYEQDSKPKRGLCNLRALSRLYYFLFFFTRHKYETGRTHKNTYNFIFFPSQRFSFSSSLSCDSPWRVNHWR